MNRQTKSPANRAYNSCKSTVFTALVLVMLTFLLPLRFLLSAPADLPAAPQTVPGEVSAEAVPSSADTLDGGVTLQVLVDGAVETMTLEDYLWGVLAAEMPAAFDQQALCAQAVAARTYTLYRLGQTTPAHPDADICGDPGCCQAWMSRDDRLAQWSKKGRKTYAQNLTDAVRITDGLALFYQEEPILAAFHAASAGSTKSALEVWGYDYPYLQEVSSPEDDRSVPNYYSTVTLPREEFAAAFLTAFPKADLSAEQCADWFGPETFDEAGLPTAIQIGGLTVDTGEVRALLGLRSASFTVECAEDEITFYVTGYGHGVGMSQYGANALAKDGSSFEEILDWYYHGAELRKMTV